MQNLRFVFRFTAVLFSIFVIFVSLSRSSTAADWHPFHICVGEMEWNATSKKWEVSLRLHPSDLQTAVSRVEKKRMEIDVEKKEIPELTKYVASHFMVTKKPTELAVSGADTKASKLSDSQQTANQGSDKTGLSEVGQAKLEWIGMEADRGWMWIYFEIKGEETEEPLYLTHRLLLHDVEDQVNTIVIRKGDKRQSLRFVKGTECLKMP